jgi:Na+/proline symporter/signal transduction histidine kinase
MYSAFALISISLLYLGSLFYIAYWGDRRPQLLADPRLRRWIYSLALAVYCTTWTVYGAVGTASAQGWAYLPIYLGPLLVWLLIPTLFERLVLISRQQKTASIADLIAARFGRSPGLAALISAIALLAAIPYISLQFKAISISLGVMLPDLQVGHEAGVLRDSAVYVAGILALFAVLFGTRRVSATEQRPGLILAVAVESAVKLVGLLAVAVLAVLSSDHWPSAPEVPIWQGESLLSIAFLSQTMLAGLAIICLPRQFHITVVECTDPADLGSARRIFIGYLVLVSLAVLPIAWTVMAQAPAGVSPDSYVLWLPLSLDHHWLAMLAFIGGLSAGTGMVIVASVALSTMISNDLLLPALMRVKLLRLEQRGDLSGVVLSLRRLSILGLTIAALLFYRLTDSGAQLASIGLMAFSAVAQFGPALLAALYWRQASATGVRIGLSLGFLAWLYTILLPALAEAGWGGSSLISDGPFGIAPLAPTALLGLRGLDPITHGVLWSLLLNTGGLLFGSLRFPPSLVERLQAAPFLDPYALRMILPEQVVQRVTQGELSELASRLLGPTAASAAFAENAASQGRAFDPSAPADRQLLNFTERLLAGVVGTASARVMLTSALRGSGLELGEVVSLLDDASQELRFNRELLQATMENVAQGISVVDSGLHLVSWNQRYTELFDFPDGMVYVGRPIADLIRFNAERGECGPGEVDDHVERRLAHMRRGTPHIAQRIRPNGTVVEMRGQPMPGGGYVTTFSDVTDYKKVEAQLRDLTGALEQRVDERTHALQEALEAQRLAKREAEAANASKSRFLAAASHDLLQPLHAARLFTAALKQERELPDSGSVLVQRIDSSLTAAEDLLSALLDISRLERGVLKPDLGPIDVRELYEHLGEQFTPIAEQRNLSLRVHPLALSVHSDRQLLRRILQNFLSNAIRYTRHGGVLLAARRRGEVLQLGVWDTGPGIAAEHQKQIFEEFHRLQAAHKSNEQGLGLGLAIVERAARTLGHPLRLRSRVGHGSQFCIEVPLCMNQPRSIATAAPRSAAVTAGQRILCLDNEPAVLEAMAALLGRWGCSPILVADRNEALAAVLGQSFDLVLADYHLDADNGLDVILALRGRVGQSLRAALITADRSTELAQRAKDLNIPILPKPVKPAALRALIGALGNKGF